MPIYPEYPKCYYYYDPNLAQMYGRKLLDPHEGLSGDITLAYVGLIEQLRGDEVVVGIYKWPFQTPKAPIIHTSEALQEFEKLVQSGEIKLIEFLALPKKIAYP